MSSLLLPFPVSDHYECYALVHQDTGTATLRAPSSHSLPFFLSPMKRCPSFPQIFPWHMCFLYLLFFSQDIVPHRLYPFRIFHLILVLSYRPTKILEFHPHFLLKLPS